MSPPRGFLRYYNDVAPQYEVWPGVTRPNPPLPTATLPPSYAIQQYFYAFLKKYEVSRCKKGKYVLLLTL